MHDYLFTTEVVRFAFMFGVAVSMLLYERRHLTTGSIVVPGYIATFLPMPLTLVATFVNAFVSYWLVNHLLRKWFLLYGRTKFTVLASISILIQTLMLKFSPSGSWLWEHHVKLMVGVGYVVPALIAHDMGRQGIKKTFKSVMLAGFIVVTPIVIALAVKMPGINDLAPLRGGGDIAIDAGWIPISVLLSAAAAWGVARYWGLRSGGFMGAAFVAILLGDPYQVVVIAILAMLTYLIVTRLLMNSMILFGRRKFSAMLLVSASMSWILLWIGGEIFDLGVQSHMDIGSLALTPLIVPGLLANDSQRTTPLHVLGGLTMATAFVLSTTWTLQAQIEQRPLDLVWKLLALASGLAIFGKPVLLKLRTKLMPQRQRRPIEAVAAVDEECSFELTGYRKWASLHQEASEAAERWLAAMLGEQPRLAVAGAATGPASSSGGASPTSSTNPAPRTVERLREVAHRALHTPARADQPAPGTLPTRRKPTHRGEFDRVAFDIASQAPRTPRVVNPRSGDGDVVAARPSHTGPVIAHPEANPLPIRSRPHAPAAGAPISETPGPVTRAHHTAPGARGNEPTDEHGLEAKASHFDVFPG